jgi:phytoene dehydrogenase-like protein
MSEENMKYDAIVIGAGISGLLSALVLSKEGKKVLVLEKNDFLGGNCRTYKVGGYSVDTGPHAITGLGDGPFAQLMDKYFLVKPNFLPINSYYAREGKKLQEIPLTFAQFAFFDILSRKDRVLIAGAMMDAIAFSTLNKKALEKSVYDYVKKYRLSHRALKFVDALSYFLSGKSMHETPAWRILGGSGYLDENGNGKRFEKLKKIVMNDYSSQGYPMGGIQNITNCMISSLPEKQVDFKMGMAAKKIISENGKAKGVETSGGMYYADLIIYSGFVKDLSLLVDGLGNEYYQNLKKIKQAKSFTLWLGLKKKLPELSYIGSELYFNTDNPYWAMPISNFDPSLAPKGKQLIGFTTVFKEDNFENQLKKLKKTILKALPSIEKYIEFEHTQVTIPEKAAVTVGVKFPSPRSPMKGLYLVGTDTDMRSMGITRVSYSVLEALKFMKEDGVM